MDCHGKSDLGPSHKEIHSPAALNNSNKSSTGLNMRPKETGKTLRMLTFGRQAHVCNFFPFFVWHAIIYLSICTKLRVYSEADGNVICFSGIFKS